MCYSNILYLIYMLSLSIVNNVRFESFTHFKISLSKKNIPKEKRLKDNPTLNTAITQTLLSHPIKK